MDLKTYLAELNKIIEETPGAGDWQVIAAADGGGHNYTPVVFLPNVGHYDGTYFTASDDEDPPEEDAPNTVLIN